MLTEQMIKQNPVVSTLTDAQIKAITEMSRNDENTVIGTKIGELHGQYDTDVLAVTGVKKNEGEKSYDYVKRVLADFKAKSETAAALKTQLDAANAKVADLQSKIEKGAGDAAVIQQLKDAKAQVEQLQAQLTAKETELATKQSEIDQTLKNTHVDYAFEAATSGLKFKDGITEPIQKTLLAAAKAEVLSKGTPDFIDNGQGGKKLVLRGADGNVLNNPKNNLNPYTLQELVMETSLKDVINTNHRQTGGGTRKTDTSTWNTVVDLSGAKTQLEADKVIANYLLANGLTRDSAEFSEQLTAIRTENKVNELPIR
jgi:hypothetical protein